MPANEKYKEKELLLRIAKGDERAFTLFYEHYYNILRPFIIRNASTAQSADEILQMTFLRVWLNRHKLEEVQNIRAWMIKIASREYLSYLRDTLSRQLENGHYEESDNNIALHRTNKVEFNYAVKEIRALVTAAVKNLSPQRKQVFHLSRNENLSIQEIACKLELAPKTVKNTLTAALNEIRDCLRAQGYDLMILLYCAIANFS